MQDAIDGKSSGIVAPRSWARAQEIAENLGISRSQIYPLAKRFKIPSVSLAEPGHCGVRLFRADLFLAAVDDLAAKQAGQPFPQNKGHRKIKALRTKQKVKAVA